MKIVALATKLFKQFQAAPQAVRTQVEFFLREALRTGVLPLAMVLSSPTTGKFYWLVFDRSKFASDAEMRDYLTKRTPAGLTFDVLFMC